MYILEDVWFGNFTPSVRKVKRGSRYDEVSGKSVEYLDAVRSELSPEGKKALDDYYAAEMELGSISERDAFYLGVRFGAGFMADVFGAYSTDLPQI